MSANNLLSPAHRDTAEWQPSQCIESLPTSQNIPIPGRAHDLTQKKNDVMALREWNLQAALHTIREGREPALQQLELQAAMTCTATSTLVGKPYLFFHSWRHARKIKGRHNDALLNFVVPLVVHAVVGISFPRHFDVLGRHFGLTTHLHKNKRAAESARESSVAP